MEVKFNPTLGEMALYATKYYNKGDIVFILTGETFDHPTRESIHVGNNIHIYDEYGIFMNHSFHPTTKINKYEVIALVDINPGDELTFNYNETEVNMASPFIVDGVKVCGKITSTELRGSQDYLMSKSSSN